MKPKPYASLPLYLEILPEEAEVVSGHIDDLQVLGQLRPAHSMRPGGVPEGGWGGSRGASAAIQ